MAAKDDYLIDTLVEMGLLMSSDIENARAEADSTGEGVIDTLVKQGILASSQVATAKAAPRIKPDSSKLLSNERFSAATSSSSRTPRDTSSWRRSIFSRASFSASPC